MFESHTCHLQISIGPKHQNQLYIYNTSDLDIGGNYEYSPFEYPETVGK